MAIQTQDRVKVTVSHPACAGDWYGYDGYGGTFNTTKLRETAAGPKVVVKGESELNDVTTKRYFDASRDGNLLELLQGGDALEGTTVTIIALDAAGVTIGNPITLAGCAVVSWDGPTGDANGDSPSEISLTWSVGSK